MLYAMTTRNEAAAIQNPAPWLTLRAGTETGSVEDAVAMPSVCDVLSIRSSAKM